MQTRFIVGTILAMDLEMGIGIPTNRLHWQGYGYAVPVWLWLCLAISKVMVTLLSCKRQVLCRKVMVMLKGNGNRIACGYDSGYESGNGQRNAKQEASMARLW